MLSQNTHNIHFVDKSFYPVIQGLHTGHRPMPENPRLEAYN